MIGTRIRGKYVKRATQIIFINVGAYVNKLIT